MGQQQLLLIVLGVIVVGIAVVVGINLFNANAESSAKDTIISEGTNLGALAQQYYKKPTSMDGGGNSFTGWSVPASLASTPTTTWSASVGASTVTLTGTPLDSDYSWEVTTTVTSTAITSSVN
ncbi:MAG: hypothetical protein IPJ03_10380 [Ignavibacteriales bacterium]|nr:hypothetical protein [Ignavibacteriales bacterium]MBK7379396.1 hypothetical protein [Ignavibacteriales bacterium]